jgi:hypothetical protein
MGEFQVALYIVAFYSTMGPLFRLGDARDARPARVHHFVAARTAYIVVKDESTMSAIRAVTIGADVMSRTVPGPDGQRRIMLVYWTRGKPTSQIVRQLRSIRRVPGLIKVIPLDIRLVFPEPREAEPTVIKIVPGTRMPPPKPPK